MDFRLRIFKFYNNSFNNERENKEYLTGDYCTFGYFDALDTKAFCYGNPKSTIGMWNRLSESLISDSFKSCRCKNIACITADVSKDIKFWEKNEEKPFLFISFIRTSDDHMEFIDDSIANNEDVMAYYTNIHSEIVVVIKGKSYKKCINTIDELRSKKEIRHIHTIFSILENELLSCENIQDEIVCLSLRASVRTYGKSPQDYCFYDTLKQQLACSDENIIARNIIGGHDVEYECKNVSIKKALLGYKMGMPFTHPEYDTMFYDLTSEFYV